MNNMNTQELIEEIEELEEVVRPPSQLESLLEEFVRPPSLGSLFTLRTELYYVNSRSPLYHSELTGKAWWLLAQYSNSTFIIF